MLYVCCVHVLELKHECTDLNESIRTFSLSSYPSLLSPPISPSHSPFSLYPFLSPHTSHSPFSLSLHTSHSPFSLSLYTSHFPFSLSPFLSLHPSLSHTHIRKPTQALTLVERTLAHQGMINNMVIYLVKLWFSFLAYLRVCRSRSSYTTPTNIQLQASLNYSYCIIVDLHGLNSNKINALVAL